MDCLSSACFPARGQTATTFRHLKQQPRITEHLSSPFAPVALDEPPCLHHCVSSASLAQCARPPTCARTDRCNSIPPVNTTRLALIVIASYATILGVAHFRALVNPISALCVPLAISLLTEEVFLPWTPFSDRAALYLGAAALLFTTTSLATSPGVGGPLQISFRTATAQRFVLRLCLTGAVGFALIWPILRARLAAAGQNSEGFNRELASQAVLADRATGLILRMVLLGGFLVGPLIGLYWLARGRRRALLTGAYFVVIIIMSLTLRARLNAVFIAILFLLLIAAVQRPRLGRGAFRLALISLLSVVALAGLFMRIAESRYGTTRGIDDMAYATSSGPAAMSVALDNPQPIDLTGTRGQSIAGLLDLTGARTRGFGSVLGVDISDGKTTLGQRVNVYTGVYLLIRDLSLPLTLALFAVLGHLASRLHRYNAERPTTASLLGYVNLLLLLAVMESTTVSTYNFWWLTFLVPLLYTRWFVVRNTHPSHPVAQSRNQYTQSHHAAPLPQARALWTYRGHQPADAPK